ncbi:unnamed protein product [Effrenium voratum]|nr:unnamed protein product [Effrenium voratum]
MEGSMRKLLWESDLLMWKQPTVTGAVLGSFNCFFLAVFYWDLSLVPFLCNIFTLVLMAGGAFRYAWPHTADSKLEIVSQDAIMAAAESMCKVVKVTTEKVRDIVMWHCAEASFAAFGFLQLIRVATPYCSLLPVCWLIGNLLFTVPIACQAKKAEIEPYMEKLVALKDDILSKVPKYTDALPKKE